MESAEERRLATALADRYRLDRELGRGGWGVVYLAQDLRHHRPVAIKVMEVGTGALATRERMRREIELEANLDHPHIVPLFDSGEAGDSRIYFVMPFVDGESLQQRIAREKQLPVIDAVRIARDVAEALQHAHARGVIHRDVKPANILLSSGSARVADFGIARAIHGPLFLQKTGWDTTHGVQVGTAAYMAPEQEAGDRSVDGRADQYSLGCVLYEMLTGRPPFDASSRVGLAARHAMDPVPSVRTVRPSVPAALEAILCRALEKLPAERFEDAGAMAAALEDVLHGASGAVTPSGSTLVPRADGTRRRTLLLAVGGAALLTALASYAIIDVVRGPPAVAADTSALLLFGLEGDSAATHGADEQVRRAIARWDGLRLVDVFAVREALGGRAVTTPIARRVSRELGAGRFLRGSITVTESGTMLQVALADVDPAVGVLAERTERLPFDADARDSIIESVVDRLLVRAPPVSGWSPRRSDTRSLPAVQHFVRGRTAVNAWALDSAAAAFDLAWRSDPRFAEAALWVALTRFWLNDDASSWRLAAHAAVRDSSALGAFRAAEARALLEYLDGDIARACRWWDAQTTRDIYSFVAWYSAAVCHDRDDHVVRDPRSPSGWRFRGSYHSALQQYLRAFQLMPSIHKGLRAASFERLRTLLYVSVNSMRVGTSTEAAGQFLASASLHDDTLVFIPYPAELVFRADHAIAAAQSDRAGAVVRRQRELFRDLTIAWLSTDPTSIDAHEAQALALQLLGDPTALDTLDKAVALARTPEERANLAGTEVWVRVRFAIPDDRTSLRASRLAADTALRLVPLTAPHGSRGDRVRASLAALIGRVADVRRLASTRASRMATVLPAPAAAAAAELELWSAFGGPRDTLTAMAERVDSLITRLVPREDLARARSVAFARSVRLAWPDGGLPARVAAYVEDDYLVPALAADLAKDTLAVRRGLTALRALRQQFPPRSVSYDALLPEAALLARYEGPASAIMWLDEALAFVRTSPPDFDPTNAAALVRLMALRAELAGAVGDDATARRWAAAVVELWQDGDDAVQPLVRRMRVLSR